MIFLIPSIIAAAVGALISLIPYGYALLPVAVIFTLMFVIRRATDKNFRGSDKETHRTTFFIVFWVVVALFYIHGANTFIPKMDKENITVGSLVNEWKIIHANIDFQCDRDVAQKQISIHTITRLRLKEALGVVAEKTGAKIAYKKELLGRSIAGGPRIIVIIHSANPGGGRLIKPEKPFFDSVQ